MNISKNYKEKITPKMMNKGMISQKKGQIAIFVIIAIVIVSVILVIFLYPRVRITTSNTFSPEGYLRECIQEDLKENVAMLAKQGGYREPEGFALYKGEKIKYLCYSSEYYKTCYVQQPNIKGNFEKELNAIVKPKIEQCARDLKEEYENQGYNVVSSTIDSNVEFVPGNIKVRVNAPMTITKDASQSFNGFDVKINSKMYELTMIALSIIDYESTYGDSETTLYLQYYPNLKIDKSKLSDGTSIYVVSDVTTNEEFKFASRSLAWPAGYGLE